MGQGAVPLTHPTSFHSLPTTYAGVTFRSRLEARWAVFFDELQLAWEYEPEGFELPDGDCYLPDFWLPELATWYEVKGTEPAELELERLRLLALTTGKRAALSYGGFTWRPGQHEGGPWDPPASAVDRLHLVWPEVADHVYALGSWSCCSRCEVPSIMGGLWERFPCRVCEGSTGWFTIHFYDLMSNCQHHESRRRPSELLVQAYEAARTRRFTR